jgi:hypothetical protein
MLDTVPAPGRNPVGVDFFFNASPRGSSAALRNPRLSARTPLGFQNMRLRRGHEIIAICQFVFHIVVSFQKS